MARDAQYVGQLKTSVFIIFCHLLFILICGLTLRTERHYAKNVME